MTSFTRPNRPVDRVFLHCTASSYDHHDDIEVVRAWHLGRGWSDVGYHFMIHKDGSISAGRDLEKTPAAQKGHNKGTIAIAMHGGQDAKDDFSTKQIIALRDFCEDIRNAYGGAITFHGHSEVVIRDCPVYDYKAYLKLAPDGRMPPLRLEKQVIKTPPARPAAEVKKPKRRWLNKMKAWLVDD
jgi:N-acetylmuramoyl-L-alanine amidase